jgi:hypothetical protein
MIGATLLFLAAAQANEGFSYYCLGATHGCVLSQHMEDDTAGFYATLVDCESYCPRIGKDLSWECQKSGNCMINSNPPDPKNNRFATFSDCSNAPGGTCFAPGAQKIAYECHGAHFGCVGKEAEPDGKTLFATFDECATACHRVPEGMSFGCAGTRPNSCVLLMHESDEKNHYFPGLDECKAWCDPQDQLELVV